MQEQKNIEAATIPYAAHEAQMARNAKQMRLMTIALCFMALLLFLMAITCIYGYEEEVTTTTTTTEEVTTDESVAQDSGDGGSNIYAGGDYNGDTDGQ